MFLSLILKKIKKNKKITMQASTERGVWGGMGCGVAWCVVVWCGRWGVGCGRWGGVGCGVWGMGWGGVGIIAHL